jgi:uncharacterized protein (DUF885 family)
MRLDLLLLVLMAGSLVLCACAAGPPADARAEARALFDEDWAFWMHEYPELATALGYPGQDDRWTDYSPAGIARRNDYLRRSRQRLAGIDRGRLAPSDRLDVELYAELLETAEAGLAFENDALPIRGVIPHSLLMPMNQLEGVAQDVPRTLALMPAATVEDYEHRVKRLRGVPALVDQTMALMENGLSRQVTPPRVAIRDLPAQVRAQLVEPEESPLLEAFRRFPASIGEADRARLARAATEAFSAEVVPAFTRLHAFLEQRYLPACRESVGVDALPTGAAMYEYNVRWHTTTDRTPKEIHETGLAEVTRIRAAMEAVMAEASFTGDFAAFAAFLRTSPRFYFEDAASLLSAYRDISKRADPELAPLFRRLPQTPYGVRAIPDATAPSQTTAYYEPGSFVAGRPAYMYANTYKLDARPKWEMEALTLHEAVPGHHLQIALAQELEDLPDFRKHASYSAYVEGWALYAESLGTTMGFYTDPYSRFGQLAYEMWRAVRLVIDTGLHAMGWTRDQAIAYFQENTPKTLQDITVEVDRYIVWPGQAVAYKIGQLTIAEIRAGAERALGPRFDVRAFHDAVLGQGAVPLGVLERRIQAWVASAGAGSRETPRP